METIVRIIIILKEGETILFLNNFQEILINNSPTRNTDRTPTKIGLLLKTPKMMNIVLLI